jgi:hypothetical protein
MIDAEKKEDLKIRVHKVRKGIITEKTAEYWDTLLEIWQDKLNKIEKDEDVTFIRFEKEHKIEYCNKMIAQIIEERKKF